MKRQKSSTNKLSIFPYLLFIAAGIISVSCATVPQENKSRSIMVNTGKDEEGKIYTSWIFDSIDSVSIFDGEIERDLYKWKYDRNTTELIIEKEIPDSSIVSVKGQNTVPCSFILTKINDGEKPLVILEDRFAIEGYDYIFDPSNNKLIFRDDISLQDIDFYVSYNTPLGGASISEIKAKNMDQIAYLETYYRKQNLDSWYDKQDSFWFLEKNEEEGKPPLIVELEATPEELEAGTPLLVKREATPEELEKMQDAPLSVLKFRNTEFKSISKEIGFNISLPEIVRIEKSDMVFNTVGKFISEYSENNKLVKEFSVMYNRNGSDMVIDIAVLKENLEKENNPKWIISENIIEILGKKISRTRQWAMRFDDINEKPEVISITSWEWTSGGVKYITTGDTDDEEIYGKFIREIIKNER